MKNAKKLINFINYAVDFTDKTGIVIDFAFTSNWRLKSFRGKQGIYIIREHGVDEIYVALTYLGKTRRKDTGSYIQPISGCYDQMSQKIEAGVYGFIEYKCETDTDKEKNEILKKITESYKKKINKLTKEANQ